MPGADLIALEPPLVANDGARAKSFEEIWNTMENFDRRGWCEASMHSTVRQLRWTGLHPDGQTMGYSIGVINANCPPFEGWSLVLLLFSVSDSMIGEVKVLVTGSSAKSAALRLQEGSGKCLWRLRCGDSALRSSLKRLLEEPRLSARLDLDSI